MTAREFCSIAQRLMNCPAAPYYEQAVIEQVRAIGAEHALSCRPDNFGNLILSYSSNRAQRPLVLAAHTDHPGFEVVQRLNEQHLLARFHGGVADSYFRRGIRVRLMPGAIAARLGRRVGKGKQFEVEVS